MPTLTERIIVPSYPDLGVMGPSSSQYLFNFLEVHIKEAVNRMLPSTIDWDWEHGPEFFLAEPYALRFSLRVLPSSQYVPEVLVTIDSSRQAILPIESAFDVILLRVFWTAYDYYCTVEAESYAEVAEHLHTLLYDHCMNQAEAQMIQSLLYPQGK